MKVGRLHLYAVVQAFIVIKIFPLALNKIFLIVRHGFTPDDVS